MFSSPKSTNGQALLYKSILSLCSYYLLSFILYIVTIFLDFEMHSLIPLFFPDFEMYSLIPLFFPDITSWFTLTFRIYIQVVRYEVTALSYCILPLWWAISVMLFHYIFHFAPWYKSNAAYMNAKIYKRTSQVKKS